MAEIESKSESGSGFKSKPENKFEFPTYPDKDKIWQNGACHCHAVEYKVFYPPLEKVASDVSGGDSPEQPTIMHCNCSICTKNGYMLVYPLRTEVQWVKGYDTLKTYRFATKSIDHKFCPECGSSMLIDFAGKIAKEDRLAMNARMIKDFDFHKLRLLTGDGRNLINSEYNDQYS